MALDSQGSSTELIPPLGTFIKDVLADAKDLAGQYIFLSAGRRLVSSRNQFSVCLFVRSFIMVLLGLLGDVHKDNFTWNLKALMSSRVC